MEKKMTKTQNSYKGIFREAFWVVFSVLVVIMIFSALPAMAQTQKDNGSTPNVGEKAQDFTLNTLDGVPVKLSGELRQGPVILIVLRGWPGYQCPYCTRQVGDFMGHRKEIEAIGARVILVYPGPAEKLKEHAEEFRGNKDIPANFKLLIDPDFVFTR